MALHQSDDEVFQGFLDYLAGAEPAGGVPPVIAGYQAHLRRQMSPEEADEALAISVRMMNDRREVWPLMFDLIYSADTPDYRLEPNRLLVDAVDGVTPGTALDVAMGQGRNAVFLAGRGWSVTGVDLSPVGVNTARLHAESQGVVIEAICDDVMSFEFGESAWDLMVFSYAPVPLTTDETMGRVRGGLRPGARLVVESFASPVGTPMRRPVDIDPPELRAALSSFDVLVFEEVEEIADWDPSPRQLVRAVAVMGDGDLG